MSPNQRKPKIKGDYDKQEKATNKDFVELVVDNDIQYGLCEIEGIRYHYQEDAIAVSTSAVSTLPQLPEQQIESAFIETFKELQNDVGNVDTIGTTCCSATAWIDPKTNQFNAWTANLGDSAAYVVILDAAGNVRTKQLSTLHDPPNTSTFDNHDPDDPDASEEGRRLTQFARERNKTLDGIVREGRLGGALKLSRGFGDTNFEEYGFSHEADVQRHRIQLKEGERAFIVVGCDGLTEKALTNIQDIGKIVQQNQDKPLDQITEALVNGAYNEGKYKKVDKKYEYYGSTDNISVAMFEVGKQPGSITVLDGHGGTYSGGNPKYDGRDPNTEAYTAGQLAKDISHQIYPRLQNNLKLIPKLEAMHKQINGMQEYYQRLARSTHNNDIKKLQKNIDRIIASDQSIEKKLNAMVALIEKSYQKELRHFTHPFLGKKKNDADFMQRINSGKDDFHYPRMLGLMLKEIYQTLPEKAGLDKNHINQITAPISKVYEQMFPNSARPIQFESNPLAKIRG